jgi:hypothetical protein
MVSFHEKKIQLLILIILATMILVVRTISNYNSPNEAIQSIAANCEFENPGLRLIKKSGIVMKWCPESNPHKIIILNNHLRIHCMNDYCIAPDFGSNVAAGYIKMLDIIMINPEKQELDSEHKPKMIMCTYEKNGIVHYEHHPSIIQVNFINDKLLPVRLLFKNRASCAVHAMLRDLYS